MTTTQSEEEDLGDEQRGMGSPGPTTTPKACQSVKTSTGRALERGSEEGRSTRVR